MEIIWFVALICLMTSHSRACLFPDALQTANTSLPWYSHVTHDGKRKKQILFKGRFMTVKDLIQDKQTRWNCTLALSDKYFVQRYESERQIFSCLKIQWRSDSIFHLSWSHSSETLDPDILCSEESLVFSPWLVIAFHKVKDDFSSCAVSGGFNMKVIDSFGEQNPCNYMDLPMRLESDCVAGEGVLFDFRSRHCIPEVNMHIRQKTLCVASWSTPTHYFTLIRKHINLNIWCLRISKKDPLRAVLYIDSMCGHVWTENRTNIKYHNLHLERTIYDNICADEYPECLDMPCNHYTKKECMKTCRVCDVRRPPTICMFPGSFKGNYKLVDRSGIKSVHISGSVLNIESVGSFQCVVFAGSVPHSFGTYSTMSISDNGCRPRFTCLKLKKLGPSVLAYSISKSLVWPVLKPDLGSLVCQDRAFGADQEPVYDLYRSYFGSSKPVVTMYPAPTRVNCNLSSAYTIRAKINGDVCDGSLYEDCKDHSRMRVEYSNCAKAPAVTDYNCIAVFEGHYWEKMVLVQSAADEDDIQCLVFNEMEPLQVIFMRAGECDRLSWGYAKNNVRKPLAVFNMRPNLFQCMNRRPLHTPAPRWQHLQNQTVNPPRSISMTVRYGQEKTTLRSPNPSLSRPDPDDRVRNKNGLPISIGHRVQSYQIRSGIIVIIFILLYC